MIYLRLAVCLAFYSLTSLNHAFCIAQQIKPPMVETFDQVQQKIPDAWNVVTGDWRLEDEALTVDSMDGESYILVGDPAWQNYEIEVDVTFRKVRNSSRWLSVLFRASPDGTVPWSQVPVRFDATQSNGVEFASRTASGWSVRKTGSSSQACQLNQQRHLKVVVKGPSVVGFLDGQPVVSSHLCVDRSSGCVGLGVSGCIAAFDNFRLRQLADSSGQLATSTTRTDIVAHRGFSAAAPENTLAAIREAIDVGATGCEFDVRVCGDGTVVLMHDKTVDRTTNGKGLLNHLSFKQVRELDAGSWKHAKYQGERVPTLAEALKLLKGTTCQPVIEIKVEGISQQVVDIVRELKMVDEVAVIAFNENVVREIRTQESKILCAWLCKENLTGSAVQQADWLQTRARQCHTDTLDLNFNMLSPELIAELKRRDLGIWTWTVNEPVVIKALQLWGVDSITTDRPDLAVSND